RFREVHTGAPKKIPSPVDPFLRHIQMWVRFAEVRFATCDPFDRGLNELKIIKGLVISVLPFGNGDGIGQKQSACIFVIPDARWYPRKGSGQGGFERIRKYDDNVETVASQKLGVVEDIAKATFRRIVGDHLVDEVRIAKKSIGPTSRMQGDVVRWESTSQFAQSRDGHYGIADPICRADEYLHFAVERNSVESPSST